MVVTSLVWLSSHWYYCQDIGIAVICIIVVKSLVLLSRHWYSCHLYHCQVFDMVVRSFVSVWLSSHCYTAILGEIEPHLSGYYTDKGVLMNKSVEFV